MKIQYADVAQSVEHLIGNEEVGSSNLLISSRKPLWLAAFQFLRDGEPLSFFANNLSCAC